MLQVATFFAPTGSSWRYAMMSFVPGTETVSSIYLQNADYSSITYSPGSGDPSEVFENSSYVETESIATGTFYDQSTGTSVAGTEWCPTHRAT